MRWAHLPAGCLLLLTLTGCSSPGVVTHAGPIATGFPVSTDFILVETSSSLEDARGEQQALNGLVLSGLRQTGFFGSVTGNRTEINSGRGMEVRIDLKEIKRVSPNDRTWFGGLAGNASVTVQVAVSDLQSGRSLQTFEIKAASGASARAGTTEAAVELAARDIVAGILTIRSKTTD